ncbi:Store-operated calcium entry-associated regulatory factor [Schistosoma japonicum]|uniref:Store-operated calcium entry-associated regulatory factor n=1 Tax=Schistosoma japonicum TaxID=6182 RepID=A0A4Z2DKR6_SCHJA|nr:Store-operated calcium entry-associated regulatory factor [Schistosoma japonicum]
MTSDFQLNRTQNYQLLAKSRRVLLRNVDVITLHHDRLAESRKGYRLPQLKCVGGSGFKYPQYYPKVVQCYNRGFDGHDVQWECKAELDKSVSLGSINVNCEGYDYPDDEFIVYDSCALEYELNVRSPIRVKRYNRYVVKFNCDYIFRSYLYYLYRFYVYLNKIGSQFYSYINKYLSGNITDRNNNIVIVLAKSGNYNRLLCNPVGAITTNTIPPVFRVAFYLFYCIAREIILFKVNLTLNS